MFKALTLRVPVNSSSGGEYEFVALFEFFHTFEYVHRSDEVVFIVLNWVLDAFWHALFASQMQDSNDRPLKILGLLERLFEEGQI